MIYGNGSLFPYWERAEIYIVIIMSKPKADPIPAVNHLEIYGIKIAPIISTAAEPNNYTTCKFHFEKFSHQPKIYFGSINRKWSFVCENAISYPSKARKQLNALHASVNNDLNHFTLPFFLIHVNIDLLLWSKEEKKPSLQLQ